MTSIIPTERLFALSCFEGLRLIRRYKVNYPGLSVIELLSLIGTVEADAHSLDMEASAQLADLVDVSCPLEGQVFYQSCIKAILLNRKPIWSRTMRSGRRRFIEMLPPDDQDVFAAAGLLDNPASLAVVTWWDGISGYARLISDQEKLEQGRFAEILTLEHERKRLEAIGIKKEPEWPGFDDNFAGYDVLSYDQGPGGVINRLIEVKSTTASPLRFIVTRNEWDKALKTGEAYIFYVWDMRRETPVLHIRSIAQVAPHIPADSGNGKWTNATILVRD